MHEALLHGSLQDCKWQAKARIRCRSIGVMTMQWLLVEGSVACEGGLECENQCLKSICIPYVILPSCTYALAALG